mgnify:CR=1 FL=1
MIRSLLISIRVKDELVDFYLQAAFNVLSELVRQEVVAKTNTAIMHRDNVVEVAGVPFAAVLEAPRRVVLEGTGSGVTAIDDIRLFWQNDLRFLRQF